MLSVTPSSSSLPFASQQSVEGGVVDFLAHKPAFAEMPLVLKAQALKQSDARLIARVHVSLDAM